MIDLKKLFPEEEGFPKLEEPKQELEPQPNEEEEEVQEEVATEVEAEEPVVDEKEVYIEELKKIKEELDSLKNKKEEVRIEEKTAVDILYEEWKEQGITREMIESDDFEGVRAVVDKLNGQLTELRKAKEELEKNPLIVESQINQKMADLWQENAKEWEEELASHIPDEMKLISKMGVKKMEEMEQFIANEVNAYMKSTLKKGKALANPLLAIGAKLVKKVHELEQPKPKPKVDVEKNKKMASLNTEAPKQVAQTTELKAPTEVGHKMITEHLSKLFS